jgi:hypothetical protein
MNINIDEDTKNRFESLRRWRRLQSALQTDTQYESDKSITDTIQLCAAKIVMEKIRDSTTNQCYMHGNRLEKIAS